MKHRYNRKIRKKINIVVLYVICFLFCLFAKQWILALIFAGLAGFNVYLLFCDDEDNQQNIRSGYTKQEYKDYLDSLDDDFDYDEYENDK